tara:strand:- start:32 stop:550 length:519 start_codon:yes stop_codon:yes gene_type:complete
MSYKYFLFVFLMLFVGCKSSTIHEGKVIPHDEYKHYYVVKDQGTHKNVQEKVETVTDKIKKVFKKKPVTSSSPKKASTSVESAKPKTVKPVQIPKRRIRETQPVTELPVIVTDEKLMPMTEEQVEIIELKNDYVIYLTILQALLILGLSIFAIILYNKKRDKKINNGKVLKL